MTDSVPSPSNKSFARFWVEHKALTPITLLLGVYCFVTALTGFKEAWKLAFSAESSGSVVQSILDASLATPLTGLMSGIIITSLIQSSSATIALIVATVAAGVISIEDSVYILMGANIGTTITNSIVGLARAHKREEFERLVPSIIVDDVFKVLNVALFFTIEVFTGLLHNLSLNLVDYLAQLKALDAVLVSFPDFIDVITEPATAAWIDLLRSQFSEIGALSFATGLSFFLLLIFALSIMGEALQLYLHDQSRAMINKIFGGKWISFGIGFGVCWLLQSSSVAVSLILPLVGHAALSLQMVYHYSIGAALATTCDAGQLLSYLKFGPVGLTAGMVHILLNVFGSILFIFVPGINRVPIFCTEKLTQFITRYKHAPTLLVLLRFASYFFALPLALIMLVNMAAA